MSGTRSLGIFDGGEAFTAGEQGRGLLAASAIDDGGQTR